MATDRADQDWPRAGHLVRERMAEQGLQQIDVVRISGISDATIRRLTRGVKQAYGHKQLAEISKALGWPPNTIERLSRGEDVPRLIDYLDREGLLRKVRAVRKALDDVEDDLRRSPRSP